jgi:acyl carrier protein
MENQEILKTINSIVRELLNNNEINISEQTTAKDVDGWDSLTNINIITAIEEHFKIRFKLKEILGFKNIGDICNLIIANQK